VSRRHLGWIHRHQLLEVFQRLTGAASAGNCVDFDVEAVANTSGEPIVMPVQHLSSADRAPMWLPSGRTDSMGNGIYQGRLVAQLD
jgi:hypothetical protein